MLNVYIWVKNKFMVIFEVIQADQKPMVKNWGFGYKKILNIYR